MMEDDMPMPDDMDEADPGTCAECGEGAPPHRPFKCADCAGIETSGEHPTVLFSKGLALILAHDPRAEMGADHDVIWCGDHDLPAEIADGLERLNWHYDHEADSWAFFV